MVTHYRLGTTKPIVKQKFLDLISEQDCWISPPPSGNKKTKVTIRSIRDYGATRIHDMGGEKMSQSLRQ